MSKSGKNKRKNFIIFAAAAVFTVVIAIWAGFLVHKNIALDRELGEKQNELTALQEENAALNALVDEENETALMEEYARKSGYVYPDERVYINGN